MDKRRKYMTEAGLSVSLNHFTLVLANRLSEQEKIDPYQYHLYSILCGDKVYFDEETKIVSMNGMTGLRVVFFSFDEHNNKKCYELPFLIDVSESKRIKLDYSQVRTEIIYPNELLKINIEDPEYITECGKDAATITIPAQDLFFTHVSLFWKELRLRVLYVGQSYGSDGKRTAFTRLSSHSTYQKILSDLQEKYPNKTLFIYLMEVNYSLMTSIDPFQNAVKSDDEDRAHMEEFICNLPIERQVINIAEAGIINFFKPEYNKMYKENFPDENHKGYKQYYDLDYNALTIEMYPYFDDIPSIVLYSDTAELKSPWDFIEYNLFNDNNRKNMYEIFIQRRK